MLVKDAIAGCSTGQIDGLSQQLLERLYQKGYLDKIDHPLIVCEGAHNNPYLQPLAYQSLIRAVESVNRKIFINSCLRTIMQQWMLRKQYERKICGITAAAIPGRSNHQSGKAIDIQDYLFWRSPLKKCGWKWLGAWDKWHFDYQYTARDLGQIQIKEWQILWNEHNPDKKLKVDGIWGAITAYSVANAPIDGFKCPRSLKRGDINRDVGKLQLLLRSHFNLTVKEMAADCQYGSTTQKYVGKFQQQQGLAVTGVADGQTIDRLLASNE